MSYTGRIQPTIKLVSPSGQEFVAKWRGNEITAEKTVGKFKYPNVDGTVVQDLSVAGYDWPITIYFDEDADGNATDHDTTAKKFFDAIAEKSTGADSGRAIWQVTHPRYGLKYLQPLKFVLHDDPMESDGVISIDTTWIEPNEAQLAVETGPEKALYYVEVLRSTASEQLSATTVLTLADQIGAAKNAITSSYGKISTFITNTQAEVAAIQTAIVGLINEPVADIKMMAAVINNLLQTPALFAGQVESVIQQFSAMATSVLTDLGIVGIGQTSTNNASRNNIAVIESIVSGIIGGAAIASVTVPITTREQAIKIQVDLFEMFLMITDALDTAQSRFSTSKIENQYFSQSKTYGDALQAITSASAYLMSTLFNLAAVKVFTTDRGRSTIEIAITEYKSKDWSDDTWFWFFCESNNLHGDQIYWLPAGTQIRVFL